MYKARGFPKNIRYQAHRTIKFHIFEITDLKWTQDGLYIITCGLDNKVALHRIKEEKDCVEFKKLIKKLKDEYIIKDYNEENSDN